MATGKLHKLVMAILKRTESGDLTWSESFRSDTFQLDFSKYSVQVMPGVDSEGKEVVELRILNDQGDTLEEINGYQLFSTRSSNDYENYPDHLNSIFEIARRQALGTEKAIDSIYAQLGGDPDDEIPF